MSMLAEFMGIDWLYWWQLPALGLLVVLIIFWLQYRKRQM